jgi:precorrin-6Y C5,15-methyltransferase (decarboxylating)
VLWDIGAGSGSVSIEAARLSPTLRVFAIERSPEALCHIEANCRTFGMGRIELVAGEAPAALAKLPDPNAVFLGGSGGRLDEILAAVAARLRPGGRFVMNSITLENFGRAWDWLGERGWKPEATSVQLSRTRPLGSLHCFEPEHPIVILHARKP